MTIEDGNATHVSERIKTPELDKKKSTVGIIMSLVLIIVVSLIAAFVIAGIKSKQIIELQEAAVKANKMHAAEIAEMQSAIDDLESVMTMANVSIANLTINDQPYKPKTLLSIEQESKCLALALYGEAANQSPKARLDLAWAIVNRAEDPRRTKQYRGSVCAAVISGKGSAINSIRPYMDAITKTTLFGDSSYVPPSAREGKPKMEREAWRQIELLSVEIMQGKYPKTTTANHFLAPRGVTNWDNWADDIMPVGKAGNHVLFRDYGWDSKGKLVFFSKSKQYRSNKHDNDPEDILRTPPKTMK